MRLRRAIPHLSRNCPRLRSRLPKSPSRSRHGAPCGPPLPSRTSCSPRIRSIRKRPARCAARPMTIVNPSARSCAACNAVRRARPTCSQASSPRSGCWRGCCSAGCICPNCSPRSDRRVSRRRCSPCSASCSSCRSSSSTCWLTWRGARRNCGSSPSPWPRSPCGWPSPRPWRASRS